MNKNPESNISLLKLSRTCIIQTSKEGGKGKWGKTHFTAHSSTMMAYFFRSGELAYGCGILYHYLSLGKGCFWNDVSTDAHENILAVMSVSETVSTRKLYEYKEVLLRIHADNGYCKNVISANNRAVDLLILFLDMNSY